MTPRKKPRKPKQTKKTKLWLEVEYNPEHTDPEGLANALDRLLETALSAPGITDEYGEPHFGPCWVASTDALGGRHLDLLGGQIQIDVDDGAANITSALQYLDPSEPEGNGGIQQKPSDDEDVEDRESWRAYNRALDGMESLLLALAAEAVLTTDNQAGVDSALQATLNALENQF